MWRKAAGTIPTPVTIMIAMVTDTVWTKTGIRLSLIHICLTLEAGARHEPVVFARAVVHHLHAVRIERLIKIIRVEYAHHVVLINAGERHIVLSVEVQTHHGSAAAAECIAQTAVLPEIHRRTGQIPVSYTHLHCR